MKIWIDIGHGGKDPGAVSGSFIERDINVVYAQAMARALLQYGADVRVEQGALSIIESAAQANIWPADLLISCHVNAGGGDRGEVFFSKKDGSSRLAQAVANGLKAAGQTTVSISYKANSTNTAEYYSILRNSKMPGVIIEPCFIDNIEDRKIIDAVDKQGLLGRCIAEAIVREYGLNIKHYKETIQQNVGFSDPDGVWKYLDQHPFAESLYRKWAESYK